MSRTTKTSVIAPHTMSSMIIGDSPDIFTSTVLICPADGRTEAINRVERPAYAGSWPLFAGIIVPFHERRASRSGDNFRRAPRDRVPSQYAQIHSYTHLSHETIVLASCFFRQQRWPP